MDVQNRTIDRMPDSAELFANLQLALRAARRANIPVVYVQLQFRAGAPEISSRNRMFASIIASGARHLGREDEGTKVHPAVEPQPGDMFVTKKRISSFQGSDLDILLRSLDVQ